MTLSQRLPAQQRRDSILLAAQNLFAEKGYHGVSIDEIAREVNVSPAIAADEPSTVKAARARVSLNSFSCIQTS